MKLDGWNSIPEGYGAEFDVAAAPWWLRVMYRTPLIDRFAYHLLVRSGHGILTHPDWPPHRFGPTGPRWRVQAHDEYTPPSATSHLS